MSGRDVCWRKMVLSWGNWWRWLLVIRDNDEEEGAIKVLGLNHELRRWRCRLMSGAA
jgi:hypothetical protein